jgi:hypothetical protein
MARAFVERAVSLRDTALANLDTGARAETQEAAAAFLALAVAAPPQAGPLAGPLAGPQAPPDIMEECQRAMPNMDRWCAMAFPAFTCKRTVTRWLEDRSEPFLRLRDAFLKSTREPHTTTVETVHEAEGSFFAGGVELDYRKEFAALVGLMTQLGQAISTLRWADYVARLDAAWRRLCGSAAGGGASGGCAPQLNLPRIDNGIENFKQLRVRLEHALENVLLALCTVTELKKESLAAKLATSLSDFRLRASTPELDLREACAYARAIPQEELKYIPLPSTQLDFGSFAAAIGCGGAPGPAPGSTPIPLFSNNSAQLEAALLRVVPGAAPLVTTDLASYASSLLATIPVMAKGLQR